MKQLFTTFLLLFILISFSDLNAQTSRDYGIMVNAESTIDPPSIKLTWQEVSFVENYKVKRKAIIGGFSTIAELNPGDTTYVDEDVEPGKAYEYYVEARCSTSMTISGNEYPHIYASTGYCFASVMLPEIETHGTVLLLIDSTIVEPLAMEIDRLVDDLVKDGWSVVRHLVPRREKFDGDAVRAVKQVILDEYANESLDINTVFLLGRVPVPYSGIIWPDGHTVPPIHTGAWPADVYYGCLNENYWTDISAVSDTAAREENNNIIGDGKFDQSTIDQVTLAVGRVDMYNMPAFEKDEIELLRQYLDKNHVYRTGELMFEKRGLVDEASSFTPAARNHGEAFASSGWRNIGCLLGLDNVYELDWFTNLENDSYMWAYGTGPGGYSSAKDVGNTNDFASKGTKSVFTMLFGSYFGDWDHSNSFLRAPLASEPSALTCCWSARPHWYFHHMGLGLPIGFSTVLSQNNYSDYNFKLFYVYGGQNYGNGASNPQGNRQIHVALMGDPTLRMHMATISAPANLSAIQTGKYEVSLQWTGPATDDIHYYNVYRSFREEGPFHKINDEWVSTESYVDSDIQHDGDVYYLVRRVAPEHTYSGSFYNQSPGDITSVLTTDVEEHEFGFGISASPNPAYQYSDIKLDIGRESNVKLCIYDINGNEIAVLVDDWLQPGRHSVAWNLTDKYGRSLPSGLYFARLQAGSKALIEKISIIR